jgi:hypothetical protein
MKKAVAALIALIMTASLCGCSITLDSPESTVDGFFSALKDKDAETLILYTDNNDINTLLNNNIDEEYMNNIYGDLMKNLSWTITSVKENEEQTEAIVTVEVTNSDFSKALKKYKAAAVDYMMDNLYKDEVTKKVMKKECMNIFASQINSISEDKDNLVTETVEINLKQNESHTWDMEVTKELTKAALGGMKWPAN